MTADGAPAPTVPLDGAHGPRLLTREFVTLACAASLFFAGMGPTNPVLPKFVVDSLGGSEVSAGLVIGSFAITSLVLRGTLGRLGDRRGARRLLIIGSLLGGVGTAGFVLVTSVAGAVAVRLVFGAGQAAVQTGAVALAVAIAPEHRRGQAASYVLVSFHVGMSLGPLLGEALLRSSSFDTTWTALSIVVIGGAVVSYFLPRRPRDLTAPPSPLLHRRALLPGSILALGLVPFVSFTFFLPLYGRELDVDGVGAVYVAASAVTVLLRVVFGRLPDRLGPTRTSRIALLVTAAGVVLLVSYRQPPSLYASAAALAGGMALLTPALVPAAVRGVPPEQRSSAIATFTMFQDVSIAATGPLFGLLAGAFGYPVSYVLAGCCAVAGLALVQCLLHRHGLERVPVD